MIISDNGNQITRNTFLTVRNKNLKFSGYVWII